MKRLRFMKHGPLAIAPAALGVEFDPTAGQTGFDLTKSNDVAIVEICGPLTHHQNWFFESYEAIDAKVSAALASDCTAVVLSIDSPGGDVSGCFELSRSLRAQAKAQGKRLIAFVDGQASSAAYALACACDEIVLPETASVGSIGVVHAMADQSALDKSSGINFAIVTSGARKADGNPHVPISEEAIAECQTQVDYLAGLFFGLVSESRPLSKDLVRDLQAASFHGTMAVNRKLADRVCTLNQLLAELSAPKATAAEENPMDRDQMKAALAKMAEGDDEDAKRAKKALAAFSAEDEEKKDEASDEESDEKKDDKEEKDEAAGEDDEDKAEDDDKKDEAKAVSAAEKAAKAVVAKFERKLQAREESAERTKLLASRPDFPEGITKTLAAAPISIVRDAVKSYPKFSKPSQNKDAIAGATAGTAATRGEGQTDQGGSRQSPEEARRMDERMGLATRTSAIRHDRVHTYFGAMTAEEATARLAKGEKKDGAK